MDGNKDDALKCFRIAKGAIEAGDRTRAQKFLNKARRLDPTLPIDDLLSSVGGSDPDGSANGPSGSASAKPSDKPSLRQRAPATGSSSSSKPTSSSSPSAAAAAYTEEQVSIVRQIKKKKDYYEILGVERSCSVEDVRKAYRKLSLKVHPDKNKAPGAEEAFKAVSKAFQCLSNADSKSKYDVSGSDEPVYERRAASNHRAHGFNGYYDNDVDAEEIFRNFFFGGMAPATQFRGFSFGHQGMGQRGGGGGDHGSGGSGIRTLIQVLPVLLILLLQFMPSSEPVYALSRSYPYEYRFSTEKGVNYYVRSTKFEQEFPPGSEERGTLEQKVEREYFNILSQNCRLELQRRQWGFIRETPHCEMLQQFQTAA